ncbi:YdeI/OmpD-associated family protein [Dyadobacter fermentans]|uniref:YdeI/OmpD-associated family protein n=1 Tax=Dyadobacter fermentans TaxID=94254 RepID=UPI001CBB1324|nr:YdeI/OmpD-associated family protein [Dyadobacter fermentans]MBZ1357322.1 YdeI/OmpD-associated family protein [Dyadobacter fermentans]
MEELLINQKYQLEKFPGKGGWTYVILPEIPQSIKRKFGMVKVKGRIDDYELMGYNLMPMGTGQLFLPVKAEIRKKIGKKEGDWVSIELYADNSALAIPEELIDCLKDEPKAYANFLKLGEGAQKEYRDWVYSAKKDETKVARIAKMIDMLLQGRRLTGDQPI